MSAFVVGPLHIAAIVGSATWYARGRLDRFRMGESAADLAHENVRSVAFRYSEPPDRHVVPLPRAAQLEDCYRQPLTVAALLRAIDCLEYQSCEHPGWAASTAARWLAQARHYAVSGLPGYDSAPWEVTSDNLERARLPLRDLLGTAMPQVPEVPARARVALDYLESLGGGGRAGAAEVLTEVLALDEALVTEAAKRR